MRVTQQMIDLALRRVTDMLSEAAGRPVAVTLHRGNGTYKIHNVLIVNGVNVWRQGLGGCTAADCYRALDTMVSTLSTVIDLRSVPEWDCETEALSLDNCRYYGFSGYECAGPRVGRRRSDDTILCEHHYNVT